MIDLGQIFYDDKKYFFQTLSIRQVIINPELQGYPPIFLICRKCCGGRNCEYAIGTTFLQFNCLLMKGMPNHKRLLIAERLADALTPRSKLCEFSLIELLGEALEITNIDICTVVKKFNSEECFNQSQNVAPFFFFELM